MQCSAKRELKAAVTTLGGSNRCHQPSSAGTGSQSKVGRVGSRNRRAQGDVRGVCSGKRCQTKKKEHELGDKSEH